MCRVDEILQVLVNCPARLSTAEGVLMADLEPPERPKYERALRGLGEEINAERPLVAWGARRLGFRVLGPHRLSTIA